MDLSSAIIGIVIAVLFIGPIVYLQYSRKSKEKNLLKIFVDLTAHNNLTLSEKDVWTNKYCIGMDRSAKKLVYLKKQGEQAETNLLDLTQFKKCQIAKSTINENSKGGGSSVINRLDLVLTPIGAQQQKQSLEFYNREESMGLTGELQLIEKWEHKINSLLPS